MSSEIRSLTADLKALLALRSGGDEGGVLLLLDHARIYEVTHQMSSVLAKSSLLIGNQQLLFQLLDPGLMSAHRVLLVQLGLLVLLDLQLSSSALALGLEHVGTNTMMN